MPLKPPVNFAQRGFGRLRGTTFLDESEDEEFRSGCLRERSPKGSIHLSNCDLVECVPGFFR